LRILTNSEGKFYDQFSISAMDIENCTNSESEKDGAIFIICKKCEDCEEHHITTCINAKFYIFGSTALNSEAEQAFYKAHGVPSYGYDENGKTIEGLQKRAILITYDNKDYIGNNLLNAFNHLADLLQQDIKKRKDSIINDRKVNDPFANPISLSQTSNISKLQPITSKNLSTIAMIKAGGVYEVPVMINGALKLNFIFDSGASDVSLPPDVVLTLMRTGTIAEADFIGSNIYQFADGSTAKSRTFYIRQMKIGNKTIYNVKASMSNSIDAPLLLGQSLLNRLGKITIDYNSSVITIQN
jgi:aspartyl protease family protein